jgi:hypothetical protein
MHDYGYIDASIPDWYNGYIDASIPDWYNGCIKASYLTGIMAI